MSRTTYAIGALAVAFVASTACTTGGVDDVRNVAAVSLPTTSMNVARQPNRNSSPSASAKPSPRVVLIR